LKPKPPFRLDLTAWVLRRRARNVIDQWDGTTYRRVLMIDGTPFQIAVKQTGSTDKPKLFAVVTANSGAMARTKVSRLLTQMLGLQTDLAPFYALARHDRRLAPLVEEFRGLKPPRFPSVFEGLVNAVACQQLSLTVGIELLNRMARECGSTTASSDISQPAFPGPEDLVRLHAHTLRHLGFSYTKARSLLQLSRGILAGKINFGNLDRLDNRGAVEQLMELRGVGRWTAEYVLLRGLGRIEVFPGDDVGARNRLALWLGRKAPLDYEGVRSAVRRWQPYAGLVYFHLLLSGLTKSGEILLTGPAPTRLSA
jgi:DNA-3-methyladenine glycosylase II